LIDAVFISFLLPNKINFAIVSEDDMPPREAVDERLEVVVSESPIAVRRRRLTPTPYTEYNPPFSDSKRLRRSLTGDMTTTAEWVQRCWQLHFGVSLSVLMFGYFANQPAR
jgi:hypothetical protein